MTIPETKAYLGQPAAISRKIDTLLLAKSELETLLGKCTARYEGGGNSGGNNNRIPDTIAKIIELDNRITTEVDNLVDIKTEILEKITLLSNPEHQAVLINRFINCRTIEQTAENMHFSETSIKKKTKTAIEEFSKVL